MNDLLICMSSAMRTACPPASQPLSLNAARMLIACTASTRATGLNIVPIADVSSATYEVN